jgi:TRAP-type mannitol/chloroaromatic compound transport system permease small subunit
MWVPHSLLAMLELSPGTERRQVVTDILVFVIGFLLPGLALIIFAGKLVEFNVRAAPRLYGPTNRAGAYFVYCVVGFSWIVLGFVSFILHG